MGPGQPPSRPRQAATIVEAIVDLRVALARTDHRIDAQRPDQAALDTLDTLRHTAIEPADAANTAVFDASKTFDLAHVHYRQLNARKQTLTNRITEIEQLPMRKRGKHRAELAGHQHELADLQPEIDTSTVERAEALRALEDAEHRANARNGLPTSQTIAARETFLAPCHMPDPAPLGQRPSHHDLPSKRRHRRRPASHPLRPRPPHTRERWQIHPEETSLLGPAPENAATWQREWETITGRTPHHGREATHHQATHTVAPTPL